MATKDSGTKFDALTEENFGSWIVNIRAELRSKKLWKYTQSLYAEEATTDEGESSTTPVTKKEQKAMKQWEEKSQDAADLMTPTISPGVQQKLTEAEFNDGYLMLTRLRILLQLTGFSEFMRLSKEYYTLQFKQFRSMSECLTHVKVLEEKIDATKITLNTDNRTILCLSMLLPQEFQYLVGIWAVTPSITAENARQMVLEASCQHNQALHNSHDPARALRAEKEKEKCEHCGFINHRSNKCFAKHPEIAPDWFKDKMKDQAKGKGKGAERAREFQAKLATYSRNDDFVDNAGTHISC